MTTISYSNLSDIVLEFGSAPMSVKDDCLLIYLPMVYEGIILKAYYLGSQVNYFEYKPLAYDGKWVNCTDVDLDYFVDCLSSHIRKSGSVGDISSVTLDRLYSLFINGNNCITLGNDCAFIRKGKVKIKVVFDFSGIARKIDAFIGDISISSAPCMGALKGLLGSA
jgi:hypothetical protein